MTKLDQIFADHQARTDAIYANAKAEFDRDVIKPMERASRILLAVSLMCFAAVGAIIYLSML